MKRAFQYCLAALAVGWSLLPIYWLVTIAFKREIDQFASPPRWFDFVPTLDHFRAAFTGGAFGGYFWNSVLVATVSTALAIAAGVPAAYALSRWPWPRLSFWILSTRMMPPIVTVVPLYLLMGKAGLLNSRLGLCLVYTVLNLPFVIWMMRGFFDETPRELEDAALLDGASRWNVFCGILLPLVKPGLAATAVFCMVMAWNEFLFALVLTQTESAMTLPVGIASRVTQYEIRWGAMSAGGVVAMLPVLLFASAVQRYLVRGLTLGAVKG